MIEELKEELHIYNLLRQLFLKEPSKEIILALSDISLDEGEEVDAGLKLMTSAVRKNKDHLDAWLEELAIEYARLFIGPQNPPAPPYASFYISESKTLMTDETVEVRKKYLEAGMAVKELYSVPDDHAGIEFEFIYYLTQRIIELFEKGQREESTKLYETRSSFIREHMSAWIPLFANKINESTPEDFYRGLSMLSSAILQ
jgi:TorA maturation chaperone TorD